MFRIFTTGAVALVVATGSSQSRADETTPVPLPPLQPITITYRAFDPGHVLINENALLSSIARALTDLTKFKLRTGEPDTKDAVSDTGCRTTLRGDRHDLAIEYLAVTRFLSGGATGTTMVIPVSYSIARTDDLVTVTFTFPEKSRTIRHGMPFLTRKLWAMDDIVADYENLTTRLASVDVQLNWRTAGELESKYKPDAVLGNLERMLGRSDSRAPLAQIGSSGSVTKEADYVYTDHGVRRQVHVATYPYHDGAKISYTAFLPYTLRSDGSVTGDDTGGALRALLSKVVND